MRISLVVLCVVALASCQGGGRRRDVVVEEKYEWIGERVMKSSAGAVIGFILFVVAFPVLFLNEGRAVRRHRTLQEGLRVCKTVSCYEPSLANDGSLVHVVGDATAAEECLVDNDFGVVAPHAIKLHRSVSMYQWKERVKSQSYNEVGGGRKTRTTYTYEPGWSETLVNHNTFKEPMGHENPPAMTVAPRTIYSQRVTLGMFVLPESIVLRMGEARPLSVAADARLPPNVIREGSSLYVSQSSYGTPHTPMIGDVRVTFTAVSSGPVTVVARQSGSGLTEYASSTGSIVLVESGVKTMGEMFAHEERSNTILAWVLRVVGFVLLVLGMGLMTEPVAVLTDVLPLLGSVARLSFGLLTLVIALPLTVGTIAAAWLFYRPMFAMFLAVAGLLAAVAVASVTHSLHGSSPTPHRR